MARSQNEEPPEIQEEAELEPSYDAELLRRMWQYVRPYRAPFAGLIAILPIASGLMLVQPYLLKVGIDRYVEAGDVQGLSRIAFFFFLAVLGEFAALYFQYYLTMLVAQSLPWFVRGC